ncbi:hypothetical protein SeMB42_g00145 [Synchytrium endobioticum]|uniref:Uncharacterized protein n=1 Tax=Synchytrium endobioticum TaxID=286115 RepID=A0A507DUP0_9FUNG|nr:hypothetical protein SeMB42_g00145 [Synchytrium endobioticum]
MNAILSNIVYELVVLAETSLNLYLQANPLKISAQFDADVPSRPLATKIPVLNLSLPDVTSACLEAIKRCEGTPRPGLDRTSIYMKQAHAILARLDLISGQYQAVVNRLQALSPQAPELTPLPDLSAYSRVMLTMSHFLHGYALELMNQDQLAIAIYADALRQIESGLPDAIVFPNPDDVDQWTLWVEQVLYHHSMLCLRHNHVNEAQKILQIYLKFLAPAPVTFLTSRRIAVGRAYLSLISTNLPRPLSGVTSEPTIACSVPVDVQFELVRHLPTYERLVTSLLPFPKGENETPIEKGRAQRVAECYDWWVMADSAGPENELVGDLVERHYRLIETLYRGTKHTFQSMRLLRYLSHAFASLVHAFGDNMSRDEKREAAAAVEAYLFIFNTRHHSAVDLERKRREDAILFLRRSTLGRGGERKSADDKRKSMERRMMAAALDTMSPPASSTSHDAVDKSSVSLTDLGKSPVNRHFTAGNSVNVTLADSNTPIRIDVVDEETVGDVLGVLISGIRILLSTVQGDERKLEKAIEYGRRGVDLIKSHAGKEKHHLLRRAQQWLGISLAELALEVRDSGFRRQCQAEALEALQDAAALFTADDRSAWDVLYQLALQAAELGEIGQAYDAIQQSLTYNPTHIPSWNLLALLLSSKKAWDDGIRVIETGWTHSINHLVAKARTARKLSTEVSDDASKRVLSGAATTDVFSWDWVDTLYKEDLISLKLTSLALEAARFGPKAALDSVHSIFALYRKFFGYVLVGLDESASSDSTDVNRSNTSAPSSILYATGSSNPSAINAGAISPSHSPSASLTKEEPPLEPLSLPKSLSPFRFYHSRNASTTLSSTSPSGTSPSSANLPALYRLRQYDLLLQLWITVASLYREIDAFSEAAQAVDTAEHVAEVVAMIDGRTAEFGSGRLFGGGSVHQVMMDRRRVGTKKRRGVFAMNPRAYLSGNGSQEGVANQAAGRWNGASDAVKRMLADVVFESSMLRHARLVALNRSPPLTRAHKYLSPVAQVEAARLRSRKISVPKSPSAYSLASAYSGADTPPCTTSPLTPTTPNAPNVSGTASHGSVSSTAGNNLGMGGSKGSTFDLRWTSANGGAAGGGGDDGAANGATPTDNTNINMTVASQRPISLDSVIQDLHLATLLDDDHLPARVCLALLYSANNNHSLAASILERAVKRGKARGCGGGSTGITTVYGGMTGCFGWESWRALGLALQKVGRLDEAKTSLMFSVKLERVGFARGAELLKRVVY